MPHKNRLNRTYLVKKHQHFMIDSCYAVTFAFSTFQINDLTRAAIQSVLIETAMGILVHKPRLLTVLN